MIENIKRFFEYFVCEEFLTKNFMQAKCLEAVLECIQNIEKMLRNSTGWEQKGVFNANNFKEYAVLYIDGERVMLKISRGNDNNSKIISLSVYNDKIMKTTSGFLIEKNKYSKKDVTKEIEYKNKIRYI